MDNAEKPREWELLPRVAVEDCCNRALCRLVATLHASDPAIGSLLGSEDEVVLNFFHSDGKRDVSDYYDFGVVTRAPTSPERAAKHFFYGDFRFSERRPGHPFTALVIPEFFLDLIGSSIEPPADTGGGYYLPSELNLAGADDLEAAVACTVNYLLKNFWHNFVHNAIQQIHFHNYARYQGEERHQSDFEADNLANVFLARSYDLTVQGSSSRRERDDHILELLRRNRCNKIFRQRAVLTGDAKANHEPSTLSAERHSRFEYREWIYRRGLANYLSGWLLAVGRAPSAISVQLSGKLKEEGGFVVRDDARPIIQVNGFRWAADDLAEVQVSGSKRRQHYRKVTQDFDDKYRAHLEASPAFRRASDEWLSARFIQAGLSMSANPTQPSFVRQSGRR